MSKQASKSFLKWVSLPEAAYYKLKRQQVMSNILLGQVKKNLAGVSTGGTPALWQKAREKVSHKNVKHAITI